MKDDVTLDQLCGWDLGKYDASKDLTPFGWWYECERRRKIWGRLHFRSRTPATITWLNHRLSKLIFKPIADAKDHRKYYDWLANSEAIKKLIDDDPLSRGGVQVLQPDGEKTEIQKGMEAAFGQKDLIQLGFDPNYPLQLQVPFIIDVLTREMKKSGQVEGIKQKPGKDMGKDMMPSVIRKLRDHRILPLIDLEMIADLTGQEFSTKQKQELIFPSVPGYQRSIDRTYGRLADRAMTVNFTDTLFGFVKSE